jgi:hypothetical protein
MARPVAGVRNQTLIITLPGSPKGAKENLEAVIKLLPHACTQAAGADSRSLHAGGVKKLEREAGVSSGSSVGSSSRYHVLLIDHLLICVYRLMQTPRTYVALSLTPPWSWPWT